MNRLEPVLRWLSIVFSCLGGLILLVCLQRFIAFGHFDYGDLLHYASIGKNPQTREVEFTEWPTGEGPWYSFISAWGIGFAALGLSAACFALYRFGSQLKRLKPVFKWLAIGCGILITVLALFLLEENIRGRIALQSYIRQLRAQGEKLTLAEIELPKPPKGGNGAVALIALTNQLEALRKDCPFNPDASWIVRIKFVAPGRAIVRCKQPDLGVNGSRFVTVTGAAIGRGRRRREVEEGETNATHRVPMRADWTDLDEQLAKASNVLAQVRLALKEPVSSIEIDYSQNLDARVPHLQAIGSAANWLALAALNDVHHRNLETAAANIVSVARLARFGEHERLLISQMYRYQTGLTGLNLTWEALHATGWIDEELLSLEQAWRNSSVIQNTASILEMERLFYLDSFERSRQIRGWSALRTYLFNYGRGNSAPADLSEFFSDLRDGLHAFAWRFAWLDQDELRYLRRYQLMLDRARNAIAHRDWSAIGLSDKDFPSAQSYYDQKRFLLSGPFTPAIDLALRRVFEYEAQRDMTIAAIGIKRYQLRTGKLPSDLPALVPEYLPELPHDWMDGNPLRYRLNSDETFMLYSVGIDGHDDGGDPSPMEGKRAFSIWNERDAVWPLPATPEEIAAAQQKR